MAAYALLVEDNWDLPVHRCFVYYIPLKRSKEVQMTPNARRFVKRTLDEIRAMISAERMPEPTRRRGRCVDCEFRNYCQDR